MFSRMRNLTNDSLSLHFISYSKAVNLLIIAFILPLPPPTNKIALESN